MKTAGPASGDLSPNDSGDRKEDQPTAHLVIRALAACEHVMREPGRADFRARSDRAIQHN
ncbi:hypothetical protein [Streptomyces liliifuscus]|uniref:Uncharacterized protein n=1 Tax=Streptomyces liliifuscus TaxID=2797636 RepID=A0A7T7I277_9ACTN|nr:hypothetical protein [Streptomyces liliifuscus]QQM39508.1 hypothetical protein JEQ17_08525 [Streptomyces liliifuscus]